MITEPNLAMVFPGQGSQSVGMLTDVAAHYPIVQECFAEASSVLGYDLWRLVTEGPAEELNQTEKTQPALLVSSYALWLIWQQYQGMQPLLLAGHSLGEYTALLCAQVFDFTAAVRLVAKRGRLMQQAVENQHGAMAAIIGLDNQQVTTICHQLTDQQYIVAPANFNAPGQIVIAGHRKVVDEAIQLAEEAGAKLTKKLPVSVPAHSALMEPAAEQLATELEAIELNRPIYPVLSNVDVTIHDDPDAIRRALVQQLRHPVQWVQTIETMHRKEIKHIVECGPGRVLCGLNKRIERSIKCTSLQTIDTLTKAIEMA